MDTILAASALVFAPSNLALALLATMLGVFVGALPGLSATMAVALLVPVTFFLPPVPALVMIVCTTASAIFAGDIPSARLRMPGTPASAAYTEDAYAMSRRGQGDLALGICLVSSVIGGLFGTVVLILLAPALADFALRFSTFEYFWLVTLGLTCAIFVSGPSMVRGAVSLLIGLAMATIGQDPIAGFPRFAYGNPDLYSGLPFIATMVGMFAVAEIIRGASVRGGIAPPPREAPGPILKPVFSVLRGHRINLLRGNLIGTAVGILPGAGADIAAWISYSVGRRLSRRPEEFGRGSPEGLVDASAANNAAVSGAWVPSLVFGIPGDSITAIVIGLLYLKGLQPGPLIFETSPVETTALFIAFLMANLLMLPVGLMAIRLSSRILTVPRAFLVPSILMLCIVGSFAVNNDPFAIVVMLAAGVLAYLMVENGVPIAPAILGLVLGPQLEQTFLRAMMRSDGDVLALVERPIAGVLAAFTAVIWLSILWSALRGGLRAGAAR
jgi:putative tricarboxylic transport membrane protein